MLAACPIVMARGQGFPAAWYFSMANRPCFPLFILTLILFFPCIMHR